MQDTAVAEAREKLFSIIREKAFFKEKIILSSGKESDYYIDARRVTLTSKGAYLAARIMLDMVKDEAYDAIGGPTLGADPLIGALGVLKHQAGEDGNTFIIRKEAKGHGKKKQIEGPEISKGASVILVDDVATTGKAFLHSLDVLDENGIGCRACLCIVDREEGAKEALAARGAKLLSIFTGKEFLNA